MMGATVAGIGCLLPMLILIGIVFVVAIMG